MNNNIALEVKDLNKEYIKGNKALDNVSFSIKKGEIVGFLGPNGAGKSTTMNIITGYLLKTSGEIYIDGELFDGINPKIKKKIGYLPETPPLYNEMTVIEYLNFVFELKQVKLNKAEHIDDIIKKTSLETHQNRLIRNLSKGYKQRVGIAGALIGDPEILIFDEPTIGLDPKQIIEIRELIKELAVYQTVILSSHIMQEIESIATKVIVINKGNIVANGTQKSLFAKSSKTSGEIVVEVDSDIDTVVSKIEKIPGVKSVNIKNSLEDLFLDLTKDVPPEDNDTKEEEVSE